MFGPDGPFKAKPELTEEEWDGMSYAQKCRQLFNVTVDDVFSYNVLWYAVPLTLLLQTQMHPSFGIVRLVQGLIPIPMGG